MLKNKKGFTLIELIIVVAIMAVLVALLAPNVLKYLEKSKVGKDIQSLDAVRTALNAEIMDEELFDTCTEKNDNKDGLLEGVSLVALADGDHEELNTLYGRLDTALDGKFFTKEIFGSKAAKGGEIKIFLDGKGGVAVVAFNSKGEVAEDADGKKLYVATNIEYVDLKTGDDK